ncbi:hypothetical protein [Salmonirosea aquatica]|uniref:Uncharacterized protein n=1 Tax=Salmonirosea aquatica TaxID=2654236 RepID=A0A7C9FBQ8_9BACT|nr:hypothetical protein [Cytophagaceae bacterium SJW1-29]
MGHISSKFTFANPNPPVNDSKIIRIEPVSTHLTDSNLAVLYFYSMDRLGHEKPVRAWFYDTERSLKEDLDSISKNYPHIPIG